MATVTITGTIKNAIRDVPITNNTVNLALVEVFESGDIGYLTEEAEYKVDGDGDINGSGIDIIVPDSGEATYSVNLPSAIIDGQETVEVLAIDASPSTQKIEDLIYGGTAPDGGEIVISGELRNPLNDLPYANAFVTVTMRQLFTTQDGIYPPTTALIKVSQGLFNGDDGLIVYVPEGEPSQWTFLFPDGTSVSAQLDNSMTAISIADILDGDYVEWVEPPPTAPDPVENLTLAITGADYDEVIIAWDAESDADDYDVEYSTNGISFTGLTTTSLLTYVHVTPTLTKVTQIYRVRATNEVGDSTWTTTTLNGTRFNLVGQWGLGESGTRLDQIGNNDLAVTGTVNSVAGLVGNASEFTGNAANYLSVADAPELDLSTALWHMAVRVRFNSLSGQQVIVGKVTTTVNNSELLLQLVGGDLDSTVYTGGFVSATSDYPASLATATWYFVETWWTDVDSRVRIRVNNLKTNQSNQDLGGANASASNFTIGGAPSLASLPLDGDVDELYLWQGRTPTYAQIEEIRNGDAGKVYPLTAFNTLVVCEGDSITSGIGSATNGYANAGYPLALLNLLGSGYTVLNIGTPSDTCANILSDPSGIDDEYSTARPDNIACLFCGTNDLYFGGTVADLQDDYEALCAGRQAVGFKVVAFTMLPRSDGGTPGTFETDRQTFNTWLRANYTDFADALADVAANTTIGDAGDETNATYYGDLVHPTDAGYAIIAGIVDAAISGL